MLNDLTTQQRKLADFMSDLSEKCYSAGWLENLEYVLWDASITGERKFGQDIVSQQDIDQLMQLSNDCNCWIYFDDITEETAIDLAVWRQKFETAISLNPDILKS
ncbi:hypothetical protein GCM10023189_33890 [Nibrella saemangeumensis]|uniref:Uncharacterized protein n=2 Tax=Nibrella saemangeumensis TaxID=1084526 RepID=A0ABP8N1N0_9BACT